MTLGTLRDQVIYPDTMADQHNKGVSDEELENFLKKVTRTCKPACLLVQLGTKGFYDYE